MTLCKTFIIFEQFSKGKQISVKSQILDNGEKYQKGYMKIQSYDQREVLKKKMYLEEPMQHVLKTS